MSKREDIDVVDLKTLRKKYLGVKFNADALPEDEFFMTKHSAILDFSHIQKQSGDCYSYFVSFDIDENKKISKIYAPKSEVLVGHNALGRVYKGRRMNKYDYWRVDKKMQLSVIFED